MRARFLAAGFPAADVEVVGPAGSKNHNLVVRYRGTGARKPVVLLAHLDVVEARREDWTYDPQAFTEKDGYFYGRGTQDIKDGAATLVAALLRMKQENIRPDRDLILALTAGEENGGNDEYNGVVWLLANRPEFKTAAWVFNVDAGDPSLKDGKVHARMVQVAEKVSFNLRLEVTNAGGHSSQPVPENAIVRLSAGVARLGAFRFPVHTDSGSRRRRAPVKGAVLQRRPANDVRDHHLRGWACAERATPAGPRKRELSNVALRICRFGGGHNTPRTGRPSRDGDARAPTAGQSAVATHWRVRERC